MSFPSQSLSRLGILLGFVFALQVAGFSHGLFLPRSRDCFFFKLDLFWLVLQGTPQGTPPILGVPNQYFDKPHPWKVCGVPKGRSKAGGIP